MLPSRHCSLLADGQGLSQCLCSETKAYSHINFALTTDGKKWGKHSRSTCFSCKPRPYHHLAEINAPLHFPAFCPATCDLGEKMHISSDMIFLAIKIPCCVPTAPRNVKISCNWCQNHAVCWCQSCVRGLQYRRESYRWLFHWWLLWHSGLHLYWLSGQMSWSCCIQLDNKLSATEKWQRPPCFIRIKLAVLLAGFLPWSYLQC